MPLCACIGANKNIGGFYEPITYVSYVIKHSTGSYCLCRRLVLYVNISALCLRFRIWWAKHIACIRCVRFARSLNQSLSKGPHLGGLWVNVVKILEVILKKQDVRSCTVFMCSGEVPRKINTRGDTGSGLKKSNCFIPCFSVRNVAIPWRFKFRRAYAATSSTRLFAGMSVIRIR